MVCTEQGYYSFEFLNSRFFFIVFKFAIKFSLVFIRLINIFVSFSLVVLFCEHIFI